MPADVNQGQPDFKALLLEFVLAQKELDSIVTVDPNKSTMHAIKRRHNAWQAIKDAFANIHNEVTLRD